MAETLTGFLKENTKQKEHAKLIVSDRFTDPESNEPCQWEMRALTAKEDDLLRNESKKTRKGKNGKVVEEFAQGEYMSKAIARCVVFPDLLDANLQDSWGVKNEVDLLQAMLYAGEYIRVMSKFNELNGYTQSMEELVDEAKN